MNRTPLIFSLVGLLYACGGEEQAAETEPPAPSPETPPAASDHGERMDLGSVIISGYEFTMARLGEFTPGTESALEVILVNGPAAATNRIPTRATSGTRSATWPACARGTKDSITPRNCSSKVPSPLRSSATVTNVSSSVVCA